MAVDNSQIKKALESGVKSGRDSDVTWEYRSVQELLEAERAANFQDNKAAIKAKKRTRFFSFRSGLF